MKQTTGAEPTSQTITEPGKSPLVDPVASAATPNLSPHFLPRGSDGDLVLGQLLSSIHVRVLMTITGIASIDMDSTGRILVVKWMPSEEFRPDLISAMIVQIPFIPFSLILREGEPIFIQRPELALAGLNGVAIRSSDSQEVHFLPLEKIQSAILHFHLQSPPAPPTEISKGGISEDSGKSPCGGEVHS